MKKIIFYAIILNSCTYYYLSALNKEALDKIQNIINERNKIVLSVPGIHKILDGLNNTQKALRNIEDSLGISTLSEQLYQLPTNTPVEETNTFFKKLKTLRNKTEYKETIQNLRTSEEAALNILKPVEQQLHETQKALINTKETYHLSAQVFDNFLEQSDVITQYHIPFPFIQEEYLQYFKRQEEQKGNI